MKEAFGRIVNHFEQIDLLLNVAGIVLYKSFLDFTLLDWDRQIAVNLRSVYLCCQQALPHMIQTGKGVIVNAASVHSMATTEQLAPYAAAKGGIVAMTRTLAIEFAEHIIRVNTICPGCVDTPMMKRSLGRSSDPESAQKRMVEAIPLQRLGTPQDVANVALFLASSLSSYITGLAFVVDGGLMAKLPVP